MQAAMEETETGHQNQVNKEMGNMAQVFVDVIEKSPVLMRPMIPNPHMLGREQCAALCEHLLGQLEELAKHFSLMQSARLVELREIAAQDQYVNDIDTMLGVIDASFSTPDGTLLDSAVISRDDLMKFWPDIGWQTLMERSVSGNAVQ